MLEEHENSIIVPGEQKQSREKSKTVSAIDRRRELMETYKKKQVAGNQKTITNFIRAPQQASSSSSSSSSTIPPNRTYITSATSFFGYH